MDQSGNGSFAVRQCPTCEGSGRVVERVGGHGQTPIPYGPRRRGGNRRERPIREELLNKLAIDKVEGAMCRYNRLIDHLKDRMTQLYIEKERWKELHRMKKLH